MLRNGRRFAAFALGALYLAACSSSHLLPAGGSLPGSFGSAAKPAKFRTTNLTIAVKGDLRHLPIFTAQARRARAKMRPDAFTFAKIELDGNLYTGDAANYNIEQDVKIAAPGTGTISAQIPFSNVPVHNNEWANVEVYGVSSDGSKVSLGQLMGLFNVTGGFNQTPMLNANTSKVFQVFEDLLQNGMISTTVLDNQSGLAGTISTGITNSGITPNATTGLFTTGQLVKLYNDIAPTFAGKLSVTPGIGGAILISRDYTNASELNLAVENGFFQSNATLDAPIPVIGNVKGIFCGNFASVQVEHLAYKTLLVPGSVGTCQIQNPANTTLIIPNVYTGHIIVSSTNAIYTSGFGALPAPLTGTQYKGDSVQVAGTPGGTKVVNTLAPVAMQKSITVSDPQAFAFGTGFYLNGLFTVYPNFGEAPLSHTAFTAPTFGGAMAGYELPMSYTTGAAIIVETFNPWLIAPANLQICGGISCYPLNGTGTFQVNRPFQDGGNKLSYYAWTGSGVAGTVTADSFAGYDVPFMSTGNAVITSKDLSSTPTWATPGMNVTIGIGSGGSFTPPAPGTVWKVTMTDINNNVYSDSAVETGNFTNTATITMDTIGTNVKLKTVQISLAVTGSATGVNITSITNGGSLYFGKRPKK